MYFKSDHMKRVRNREPETLAEIFFDMLAQSGDELVSIYYHLFSVLPQRELERSLTAYYEYWAGIYRGNDADWYKGNWFYTFHKSIRQCDFFDNCVIDYPDPKTTPEEYEELKKLKEMYINFRKDIPEDPNKKISVQVQEWRDAFKAEHPVEAARHTELNTKQQHREKESIDGHLDMILWNTIHIDADNKLMYIMERAFTEYQLKEKYKNKKS